MTNEEYLLILPHNLTLLHPCVGFQLQNLDHTLLKISLYIKYNLCNCLESVLQLSSKQTNHVW